MTIAYNLNTGEEQSYMCSPEQAVKSAYALEKNLMTQLATGTLKVEIQQTPNVVTCGNWSARK